MANGVKFADKSVVAALDYVTGTTSVDGVVKGPVRQPMSALATQLLAGGPIAAAMEENRTIATSGRKPSKEQVQLVSTANVDPATGMAAGMTYDGTVLVAGWRIGRNSASSPEKNGTYTVPVAGVASRTTDMNSQDEIVGSYFFVKAGTFAGKTLTYNGAETISLETTPLTFIVSKEDGALAAEVTAAAGNETSLKNRFDYAPIRRGRNELAFGNFDGGPLNPSRLNGSLVVELPDTEVQLKARGLTHALNWKASSSDFVQWFPGTERRKKLFNQYFAAGFLLRSPTYSPLNPYAYLVAVGDGGAVIDLGATARTKIQIDENTWLCYHYGQMPAQGSPNLSTATSISQMRLGTPYSDASTDRYSSGFFIAFKDTPFQPSDFPLLQRGVTEPAAVKAQQAVATVSIGADRQGEIKTWRGSHLIQNDFALKTPSKIIMDPGAGDYTTFAPKKIWIDGNLFRSMTDDNAPSLVAGGHHGGQHGFKGGYLTAAAHGKTSADVGSIWSLGGDEYVMLSAPGASNVVMAKRSGSAIVPTGTFTHVSGATHTGSLVATASLEVSFYPMTTDYRMRVILDGGREITGAGTWEFTKTVTFQETYKVLPYAQVIAWFIANGAADPAGMTGTPIFQVTNTYTYDIDGNLTMPTEWMALQSVPVTWLYGVQIQDCDATHFYVPKATTATHDGATRSYQLIEPAVPQATEIVFNYSNTEAGGLYLDRFVSMTADYLFMAGFLPLQDAEPTVRRSTYVTTGQQGISLSTARKGYMRAVNKGVFTANAGDTFGWTAYRNVIIRGPDRTLDTVVRAPVADFIYADWHDSDGIDTITIPPEFAGRTWSVVEKSANVTVLSRHLNGSLSVNRSTVGSYGRLLIRVDK